MTSTRTPEPDPRTSDRAAGALPVHAVRYTYVDDAERLTALRPAHRDFLRELLSSGALLASGPWTDAEVSDAPSPSGDPEEPSTSGRPTGRTDATAPGALLLVRAPDATACLRLLDHDPFALAGLVRARSVRGWDPVLGPWAG